MSARNDGGPAFPVPAPLLHIEMQGMTLRDYFAAMAMQRIHAIDEQGCMSPEITALAAYRMADAMLKAREVQA
jgi:hypothetical protein